MKRSLSGMKRQQGVPPRQETAAEPETAPKQEANQQALRETVEHYGKKSKAELFDELKRITGETGMDARHMDALAQQIAPMLSKEQQQRMYEVVEKLRQ